MEAVVAKQNNGELLLYDIVHLTPYKIKEKRSKLPQALADSANASIGESASEPSIRGEGENVKKNFPSVQKNRTGEHVTPHAGAQIEMHSLVCYNVIVGVAPLTRGALKYRSLAPGSTASRGSFQNQCQQEGFHVLF